MVRINKSKATATNSSCSSRSATIHSPRLLKLWKELQRSLRIHSHLVNTRVTDIHFTRLDNDRGHITVEMNMGRIMSHAEATGSADSEATACSSDTPPSTVRMSYGYNHNDSHRTAWIQKDKLKDLAGALRIDALVAANLVLSLEQIYISMVLKMHSAC